MVTGAVTVTVSNAAEMMQVLERYPSLSHTHSLTVSLTWSPLGLPLAPSLMPSLSPQSHQLSSPAHRHHQIHTYCYHHQYIVVITDVTIFTLHITISSCCQCQPAVLSPPSSLLSRLCPVVAPRLPYLTGARCIGPPPPPS